MQSYKVSLVTRLCGSCIAAIADFLYFFFSQQVFSKDGQHEVGKISKQWSGLLREYFTDADNFGVSCKYEEFRNSEN